jgi:hypothetical protein
MKRCFVLFWILLGACRTNPTTPSSFDFACEIGKAKAQFDPVQFRSFRKDGRLTARVSMDEVESRFSLVSPVPSRLTYEVSIPVEPLHGLRQTQKKFSSVPYLPDLLAARSYRSDVGSALTEITWEGNERRGAAMKIAVRRGALKYVATFQGDVNDPEFVSRLVIEELYVLIRDRGERTDLIAKEDVEPFRSEVRSFLKDVRSRRAAGSPGAIALDEEMRHRLRALGYLAP